MKRTRIHPYYIHTTYWCTSINANTIKNLEHFCYFFLLYLGAVNKSPMLAATKNPTRSRTSDSDHCKLLKRKSNRNEIFLPCRKISVINPSKPRKRIQALVLLDTGNKQLYLRNIAAYSKRATITILSFA